ncbi:centromere protein [Acanthamoeba castellanii str. Neff]|uniref:Centromere protein n=1 Tax=Acanthamoeba castellanii (strain ATCC 30010 / Neff) TaxID=1257118 RepID=L8GPM5_ACACF|nr:centromere protein [Acanthamoeba castellanii str. Neff]ELR14882.1 centromere protein [Acanthamoeba castellanii str. Neff]
MKRKHRRDIQDDREDALVPHSAQELQTAKDVAGKTWLTYRASPLHAFKEERLADYAASLRRHMTADCQEAVGQRWRFLAAAYRLPGLAEQHGRVFAFVVGLKSVAGKRAESPLFQAILSIARPGTAPEGAQGRGEHPAYPVFLLRGNKTTTDSFSAWLYGQFDSRVSQLSFSPYTLARMAALWGSSDAPPKRSASGAAEVLELVYKAPEYIPELNTIRLTIPQEDMRRLAAEMTEQNHNLYKEEDDKLAEVRPGLLRALEEHFFYHFRISLSAFLLYRISTPVAHVNSSGKLKLTEANISLVFQQLAIYAQL